MTKPDEPADQPAPEPSPSAAIGEHLDADPQSPSAWQQTPRLPSSLVERPWR